jgi:hypothetical protein
MTDLDWDYVMGEGTASTITITPTPPASRSRVVDYSGPTYSPEFKAECLNKFGSLLVDPHTECSLCHQTWQQGHAGIRCTGGVAQWR